MFSLRPCPSKKKIKQLVKSHGTPWPFLTVPPFLPLPPFVSALSVPLEATFYGGGGGPCLGKSRFHHRRGGDDESIANFQGVPYTCDQDCRLKIGLLHDSSELSRTDLKDVSYSRQPIRIVIDIGCQLSSVL